MSSVVTAPEGASSRLSRTTPPSRVGRGGLSGDFVLGLLGAVTLGVIAFVAAGGNTLAPNTWVQGGLVLLAALVAIAVVVIGARGRAWGAPALLAFAALAALTYASIGWSVQPANSWLEANRTLSYVAAFAIALLLARVAPGRWRALIGAVAAAASAACAYSLLVKVFPASLDPGDLIGRLRAPLDYWNAVGLMAAIGLPACLWAGARLEGARALRALAVPAIAVLLSAVVLSFSRGAVLVAVIALVIWFALAPLRLRSALVLALGAAGGVPISVWGIDHPGISGDRIAAAVRTTAGHSFGIVILVALVLSALAGFAAMAAMERVVLPVSLRRRLGGGLIGLVALIPVGGVVALAASSRGLTGEVSHIWKTLTNPNGGVGNQAGRLVQLSNSRPHYWAVAFRIGEHHPVAGVGALGFATAQSRYGGDVINNHVLHAHGYVVETFADLGSIGLTISFALLVTWLLAARRTFELRWPRRAPPERSVEPTSVVAERTGLVALLAIVVTFGVHSLIDWTWFIPGVAVPALACAGWLAGRGPLSRPVGRLADRRMLSRSPAAVGVVAVTVVVTLAALWVIAQPLRSSDSYAAAITAAVNRNADAALSDARAAASEDPVSVDPLFLLSRFYTALDDGGAARRELVDAVSRQPANPQTWEQLGCYDLYAHSTAPAASELRHALVLDPGQTQIQTDPAAFCASI